VRRQRGVGRELAFALVDPLHLAGDRRQQPHDGAADVARAVKLQEEARRGGGPGLRAASVQACEAQRDRTAAALAQGRPERIVALDRFEGRHAGEQGARVLDRQQLQMAAADRPDRLRGRHQHARAGLARHGAGGLDDLDHHAGDAFGQPACGGVQLVVHAAPWRTASMASRMASQVAGARSGGSTR
jgi:hypothetical protein